MFADNLIQLRKLNHMSQDELADQIGVSRQTLSKYETGESLPDIEKCKRLAVMNIRSAIIAESTLSFMGIGLPLEQISWGSMLSNADKALMTKSWWIILIPGLFLTVTLMCMTNLGNYLRKAVNRKESYL